MFKNALRLLDILLIIFTLMEQLNFSTIKQLHIF
jgi:hypothetical protein